MSVQSAFTSRLPNDLLGAIAIHCDPKTLYAFRSTCRAANAVGRDDMSEEVAARVIFHHPEQYRTLRWNALKESRKVTVNALTKLPELFCEESFPAHFRQDMEIVKTALIAALMLNKMTTANEICKNVEDSLRHELRDLIKKCLDVRKMSHGHAELFCLQPFVLYSSDNERDVPVESRTSFGAQMPNTMAALVSDSIKQNIDVAFELLKKPGTQFDTCFSRFLNDDAFVQSVLKHNSDIFCRVHPRLRDDTKTAKIALQRNEENIRFVGPQLTNSVSFMLSQIWSSKQGSAFLYAGERVRSHLLCAALAVLRNPSNIWGVHGISFLILFPLSLLLFYLRFKHPELRRES